MTGDLIFGYHIKMEGFHKIDLSASTPSTNRSTVRDFKINKPSLRNISSVSVSRRNIFVVGIVLLVLFLFSLVLVSPVKKTYDSGMKTSKQAKKVLDAIKGQNVELAQEELLKTKKELENTQKDLSNISFLRFVPIIAFYYNDADHIVKAGFHGIDAAQVFLSSLAPYADVLGLKGKGGTFVLGSAEQRIQTAVLTLGKITPRMDEIVANLDKAKKEVDRVEPNHYFFLPKVKNQLKTVREVADSGVSFAEQARPLIKVLPDLLGEKKVKKYLVLFQNDNEIRPTGGFLTAYAIFRVDKGALSAERSSDIYNLDNTIRNKPKAKEPISKYLKNVTTFNLRDSNLSPDFVESMKTFNSLYEDARDAVEVDGIIALDTNVLLSIIKILDDEVYAGGIRFSSKIDKRCDCPQVIYELERQISTPLSIDIRYTNLAAIQAARKDLLGTLLFAIMEKALKSSPRKYWGPIVSDLLTKTFEKHVLVYLYDKNAQAGIEALNAAGRIKAFEGDYLHINEANFGGQKANLFVREDVEENIEVASDGTVTKTVTINYKNPHPASDCNLERGQLCLNAPLRNWFRVYVPKGSTLVESFGSEVKVTTSEDLGKTVFEGFLTVRPEGSAKFTITYKLPFKAKKTLPHLIQKQPGTDGFEYVVKVNGKQQEKFELKTDKELRLIL